MAKETTGQLQVYNRYLRRKRTALAVVCALVMVRAHDHREVMLVMEVFREEIEETNRSYKPVLCKLKKNFLKKL